MFAYSESDESFHKRIWIPRHQSLSILIASCVSLLIAATAEGLVIRSYDPARHDRFASGYPSNPVINTNFHADFYDFSGVGWHATYPYLSYTLISPTHFVGANHVKPGIGASIVFKARDGSLHSYTVANQYNVTNSSGEDTDLFIGELSQPVETCDNIAYYPILNLTSEADYVGQNLLVYGHTARVGTGTINSFLTFGGDPLTGGAGVNDTRTYSFAYVNASGSGDDCHVEGGDSGSPSFVATDGNLYLVGVHLALLDTTLAYDTIDTFVPYYLDQISAVLQGHGYQPATSGAATFRLCTEVSAVAPDVFKVSWVGHRHRVYQLDAATNAWDFAPISGLITAGVSSVSFIDSNSVSPSKLYRVRRMN